MSTTTMKRPTINVDDDVDDLDDVLDQFSPNPLLAPPPTSTLGVPTLGRPRQNTRVGAPPPSLPGSSGSKLDLTAEANEGDLSEEFSRELAKEMENLMRDLQEGSSSGEAGRAPDDEKRKALRAAWEAMLQENLASDSSSGGHNRSDEEKTGVDFKTRLKKAMSNLKESESKLQGAPADESVELQALLNSLGDGDSGQDFEGFLEIMMGQLLSKEILHQPLKELSDGFPTYLAKPPTPLSEDDRQRYVKQQACVSKILNVFDKADFRDDHPEYSRQVMELMSEMQSYGSPPSEIMGDLPPGLDEKDCVIS